MHFDREELLKLRKKLNANPQLIYEGGIKPIRQTTNSGIRAEFKHYCRCLEAVDPIGWKDRLPPEALELYQQITDGGYLCLWLPHRFIEESMVELGEMGTRLILGLARFVYVGDIKDHGMGPVFVKNETIAEMMKMSFSNMHIIIRKCKEKGYLVDYPGKHISGTKIRLVILDPDARFHPIDALALAMKKAMLERSTWVRKLDVTEPY